MQPAATSWWRGIFNADGRAVSLALLMLVVALFLPPVPLRHDTYESIVIFDITQSMDVEDYELGNRPASRLAYAQEAAPARPA